MYEGGEVEVSIRPQFRGDRLPAVRDLVAEIVQDQRLRLSIHHNLAARRKEGKAPFDLALESAAGFSGQRTQLLIEPELLPMVTDEIEHSQNRLIGSAS